MIAFFARHPTAANLLMLIFLGAGALALPSLRRATFPDYRTATVEVRVPYPGAIAEDVEEAVCRRIENAVESVQFIEEIRAEARESVGIVTLEMADGGDPGVFLADVKTEVDAIDDFPAEVEAPVVRPIQNTDRVVSVAVTLDAAPAALKAYCEDVKDRLQALDAVSLVTIHGFGQRQIRIEAGAQTLRQYGLSAEALAGVVGAQSVDLPGGTLTGDEREIVLRFDDERRRPEEFADLVVVAGASGGEVRLGDIAVIRDLFDPPERLILFNGRRAGLLKIEKTTAQDQLRVYDAVAGFVAAENARVPAGARLVLTEDGSSIVRDRLQMLLRNGWQGLLLVFLAMWVFFGLRFSFWVAMGLPVAFLGALFFLPLLGMTLDMLSMVALLMALGLMMDDAIVLAENIATEMGRGKKPLDAVIDGVHAVKAGVLSSFATTVSVFVPLAFLDGNIGKVLLVVPIVLIVVLAVSLVEAFCILPHHLAHTLARRTRGPGRVRRAFERGLAWMRERVVGRAVDVTVRWRWATLGVVVAAFLVSAGMLAGGRLKFQAFPDLDGDVVHCRVLLPQGTPLARTEAVVARVTEALGRVDAAWAPRQPGGAALVRNVLVEFARNPDAKEEGPHVATVTADLLPADARDARLDDVLDDWRRELGPVPDALALTFGEPVLGPAGRAIEVRVFGRDLAAMGAEAERMKEWFARFRGVRDLATDLRPGKPEVRLRLEPGARVLGLSAAEVARQVRSAFHGATAGEIQVGVENYEVDVRLDPRDRERREDLDRFTVTLPGGAQVPLSAVARLEEGRGFARIGRVDGRRAVTLQGDLDSAVANTAEIMARFRAEFAPESRARGFDVALEGETKEGATTRTSMQRAMLIGLFGIFVLLSFQFRSWVEPVVVMVAIPLAMIGVVWGHLLLGLPLTMPSLLGFVSLSGVVVNDSILLVEFLKRRVREDPAGDVPAAARAASRDRFRAVFLTSLTTILGLLPLLSETSLQAQVLIPLATSIVFGLLASTVLVLFVIPALYAILADFGRTRA